LSTKTSASSAAPDRNRSMINPKISLQRSHIQRRIVRFSADCQPDQIYDRTAVGSGMRSERADALTKANRYETQETLAKEARATTLGSN
jgi:hypothetical protein